jgi:hypothetical protein
MGTLTVTGDTRRLLEQAVSKMDELHHRMAAPDKAREARERRDAQADAIEPFEGGTTLAIAKR